MMNRHFSDRSSDSLVSVSSIGAIAPGSDVPMHDRSRQMSGSNSDLEIITEPRQDSGERSRHQQTEKSAMPRGTLRRYCVELAKQLPDSQDTSNIAILKHGEFKYASHRRYTLMAFTYSYGLYPQTEKGP